MLRKLLPLAVLLFTGLAAQSAWASGDFTCEPSWKLKHVELDDCSNMAFLSPGNDTRINLQLLMLDRRPPARPPGAPPPATTPGADVAIDPPLFSREDFNAEVEAATSPTPDKAPDAAAPSDLAEGEGSRCISGNSGYAAFVAAMKVARGLPDDERTALTKARAAFSSSCAGGSAAALIAAKLSVKSAPGQQFATYLTGAAAFYDGDFDTAHKSFAGLADSRIPWIREASCYMLGRVELNRAQIHAFDQFSDQPSTDKVDTASLAASEAGFRAYLHDYPKGDYADSARGLLRRVYWLGGDQKRLGDAYADMLAHTGTNANRTDLIQEIDNKLFGKGDPSGVTDPLLLATVGLMQMRAGPAPDAGKPPVITFTLDQMEAQRPAFAANPALFDYLLAAHHFYVENDPAGALKLLPADGAAGASNLAFSRQVLRGMALEALNDPAARSHWTGLAAAAREPSQKGAVELALAMHDERAGDLGAVFVPVSLVRNADVRDILLQHSAGPSLLRQQALAANASEDERRLALYVLLYKEVTRGGYPAFLRDAALLPPPPAPPKPGEGAAPEQDFDLSLFRWSGGGPNAEEGYACPPLTDVARTLARAAHDPHGLLCLGEFVREGELDGSALNKAPPVDELGGAPSQFPGTAVARLGLYEQVIGDAKAPATDRTYALYRAVQCYAPSGYNHCDGTDVPIGQRKQWFKTLKTTYSTSKWADALKYYW